MMKLYHRLILVQVLTLITLQTYKMFYCINNKLLFFLGIQTIINEYLLYMLNNFFR